MTIEEGLTIMHLQKLLGPAHRFSAKGAEIWGKTHPEVKTIEILAYPAGENKRTVGAYHSGP